MYIYAEVSMLMEGGEATILLVKGVIVVSRSAPLIN